MKCRITEEGPSYIISLFYEIGRIPYENIQMRWRLAYARLSEGVMTPPHEM